MTIPKTDVGKLLELYKGHDELIRKMMDLVKEGNDETFDLIRSINKLYDNNQKLIDRQSQIIMFLMDEISRMNKRIDKLERLQEKGGVF